MNEIDDASKNERKGEDINEAHASNSVAPVLTNEFKKRGNTEEVEKTPLAKKKRVLVPWNKQQKDIAQKYFKNQILNKKLLKQQHGFLPDRSTTTNLCVFSNTVADAINNEHQLDVVLTDCAKAFDKVDHGILLDKLNQFNFSRDAIAFLKSYLASRFQQVRIGNSLSNNILVPQGSNLGALLFNMFINDLPNSVVYSSCSLYADDFKIYKVIESYEDCRRLEDDLNSVYNWLITNKMLLNIDKCAVMTYTRKVNFIEHTCYLNNVGLVRKNECKDLGVYFQANLRFHNHMDYILKKAYKILVFVIRNAKLFKKYIYIYCCFTV